MTLLDLLSEIPRFVTRHMFPVWVEIRGELYEIDGIDFRNGCEGTVLVMTAPDSSEWDDELIELRNKIRDEWDAERTAAAYIFDPAGDIISVEAAYRLLSKTLALLDKIYDC